MTAIERALLDDGAEILALQKLAYQSEAATYGDHQIPPLTQTLLEMEDDLRHKVVLKVVREGRIVGSVRAYRKDNTCYIGRLIVHPDCQNQGLGTRLMQAIEAAFQDVGRFELFTGHRSERNLHLYGKLGYKPCRRHQVSDALELVYLEKRA